MFTGIDIFIVTDCTGQEDYLNYRNPTASPRLRDPGPGNGLRFARGTPRRDCYCDIRYKRGRNGCVAGMKLEVSKNPALRSKSEKILRGRVNWTCLRGRVWEIAPGQFAWQGPARVAVQYSCSWVNKSSLTVLETTPRARMAH